MNKIAQQLLNQIEEALGSVIPEGQEPKGLYDPIRYALQMGGKRLRPMLLLWVCGAFSTEAPSGSAMAVAKAVEVFHNFTLLHDDLMDNAPTRRGKPTVYRKWDANTAILSGDAMMIKAFQELQTLAPTELNLIYHEFVKMALEVCEGQQYDMEFEHQEGVTELQYLEMIRLKTACLIASAMKMGALLGGATQTDAEKVYRAGNAFGLAFQLVDDYLDAFGTDAFGKQIGGDILAEKRSYPYLLTQEAEQNSEAWRLAWQQPDPTQKINAVLELYRKNGTDKKLKEKVAALTQTALKELESITHTQARKNIAPIGELMVQLMDRCI